jgi:hypothetical protein
MRRIRYNQDIYDAAIAILVDNHRVLNSPKKAKSLLDELLQMARDEDDIDWVSSNGVFLKVSEDGLVLIYLDPTFAGSQTVSGRFREL